MASEDKKKTSIKGGCHCGKIRYTVAVPMEADGTFNATRCNCSFCQKLSNTNLSVSPEDLTLERPSSKDEMGDYSNVETMHRYFCKECSVMVWMEGVMEFEGAKFPFFMVNVQSFDRPQEGLDIGKVKLKYYDGLTNNFGAGPKEEPWANGLP